MCRYVMHVFCAIALSFFGLLGVAQAASLGKVDVASHLGEAFYAEVPLGLDEGEAISSIFVELASPADYQVLEVFHDPVVGSIRADVKSDARGSRVELTSTASVDSPFLNIVLKVRHGRATHFKKFSIFLDLPRAAKNPSKAKVLPVRNIGDVDKKAALEEKSMPQAMNEQKVSDEFKPFDGWARTERYGPMVYGDTISTVAQRLRVDGRYSRQQVMVALFEKNKDKFAEDNINLIHAGTYLDIPSAQEVEHISRSQALSVLQEHNARWKELTRQAKYAKVKEAQKTRYGKRVRIGDVADGVADQPLLKDSETVTATDKQVAPAAKALAPQHNESASMVSKKDSMMQLLRQKNADLQQRLQDMETKVAALAAQPSSTEVLAASNARIEKLELQLARQAGELEKARKQAALQNNPVQGMSLISWILAGIIGLLSMLAGYLVYALRGQRSHPANQDDTQTAMMPAAEPEFDDDQAETKEPDVEELDVEEVADEIDESIDFEATEVDQADAFQDTLSGTIPALTDEDTSKMEAFTEEEEAPDPNVDYLTEADVYMRYGMEDEAEKQVKMALRLREDNKDAYLKLATIRHARGDLDGVEEAASTARSVLTGEALDTFNTTFDGLGESPVASETGLDDTMPPVLDFPLDNDAVEDSASPFEIDGLDLPDFATDDSVNNESEERGSVREEPTSEAELETDLDVLLDDEDDAEEIADSTVDLPSDTTEDESDVVEEDGVENDASDREESTSDAEPEADLDVLLDNEDNAEESADSTVDMPSDTTEDESDVVEEDGVESDASDREESTSDAEPEADVDTLLNVEDDAEDSADSTADMPSDTTEDESDVVEEDAGDIEEPTSDAELETDLDALLDVEEDTHKDVVDDSTTEDKAGVSEADLLSDGLDDLNLSDLDMSDLDIESSPVEVETEQSVASSLEVDDLESTVVMDWSSDTSVIGAETGVTESPQEEPSKPSVDLDRDDIGEGIDIDMSSLENLDALGDDEDASDQLLADEKNKEEPKEDAGFDQSLGSISFNLDDLDIDMDAIADDSSEMEDFTSTIQSTLMDLGVEKSELDVSLEPADDDSDKAITVDKDDSFDVDFELDSLLSDLDTLSDDDKKKT